MPSSLRAIAWLCPAPTRTRDLAIAIGCIWGSLDVSEVLHYIALSAERGMILGGGFAMSWMFWKELVISCGGLADDYFDWNRSYLREKVSNIRHFIETDCKKNSVHSGGENIEDLRKFIVEEIDH